MTTDSPSQYSWQKHRFKPKAVLKETILELIATKEYSKQELVLLLEIAKDKLGNKHG
jgi:hypothetical protein